MLGFQGPSQPSPALGDALNAGFRYLEVKCLGCDTRRTRCARHRAATKGNAGPDWNATCGAGIARGSGGYPFERSHLVALRADQVPPAIRRRRGGPASGE